MLASFLAKVLYLKNNNDPTPPPPPPDPQLRFQFWEQLLARAKSRTDLHPSTSPNKKDYIRARVGDSHFHFIYVALVKEVQVEFFINSHDKKWNKDYFARLYRHKDEIETVLGAKLTWDNFDHADWSRIVYKMVGYGIRDVEHWADLQAQMIEAMIRLEKT